MNPISIANITQSPAQIILTIISVAAGGGLLKFLTFLIQRRSALAALDRTSSQPLLQEYGAFADRLTTAEKAALEKATVLERRLVLEQEIYRQSIIKLSEENTELSKKIAHLTNEIGLARREIHELRVKAGLE